MKKLLTLLLCLSLLTGAVACGTAEGQPSDEGSDPSTETVQSESSSEVGTSDSSVTDAKTDTTSSQTDTDESVQVPWEGYVFDTETEHKFLAMDIKGHSIVVFDLNLTDGNLDLLTGRTCLVWAWDADTDPNCKINPGSGIDAAKYRYSPYYGKDVIIASSSNGWAGVIDYETHSLLWEYSVGDGPHSIEMMPNGDVVVAGSGNGKTEGKLAYIPLSAGKKSPSCEVPSPTSHGVSYDPEQNCLWVLENTEVACFTVQGEGTKEASLVRQEGKGASLYKKDSGGHVLSPVTGTPGLYWVAAVNKLWQFDSKTGTVTDTFSNASAMTNRNIKGLASFSDGTAVMTVGGIGNKVSNTWSTTILRFVLMKESNGTVRPVLRDVQFKNREFYKVFPFTKEYQP